MKVVTGATGFLGAHLVCKLLQQGFEVRALKRYNSSLDEFNYIYSLYFSEKETTLNNLSWFEADILDISALEVAFKNASTVYHAAAVVSFHAQDRDSMMKVNVEGTANVVNACLTCKISQLAYISSIAALGRAADGSHINELTKWTDSSLNSNYAISKYKAELEVWRGAEEGLQVVVVNPGVIIGAGKWDKGSCALFNMVWKNMPFFTEGINGYVDVEDVAEATISLVDKNINNQRFVLVGGNWPMKDFMFKIASELGKKPPSIQVKPWMAEFAWRLTGLLSLLTGKRSSITKETARASLKKYYYSSEKISTETGFQFRPLDYSVKHICKHFLLYHEKHKN
ncbi:MAG: NAD-dependent epimerase/dehydratase family protein [Bacteroidia bacterium]|nr:NAD-dependent epimerase/dehydratase family protein [Bacteroidia bacterium]